jgi:hypothetical protein
LVKIEKKDNDQIGMILGLVDRSTDQAGKTQEQIDKTQKDMRSMLEILDNLTQPHHVRK